MNIYPLLVSRRTEIGLDLSMSKILSVLTYWMSIKDLWITTVSILYRTVPELFEYQINPYTRPLSFPCSGGLGILPRFLKSYLPSRTDLLEISFKTTGTSQDLVLVDLLLTLHYSVNSIPTRSSLSPSLHDSVRHCPIHRSW